MDTKEPLKFLAHYGFKGIFTVISHIFFREIKTTDAHLVPSSGPCIFIVGPHANQFIDGVVIHSINPRLTHTLMADVSYQKPLIGHIGKILNAIPVVRPQDIINEGSGRIFYDPINDPNMIRGENTHFLSEINARDYIIFGRNYKIHVANIFSDTKLEIIYSIKLDAGTIGHNGVPYKIAPYIDQTPVYEEVFRCLNSGQCVTVFPEGGSHDRTELLPLKTGFAVMALEALVKNPKLDIKIIPVGLNYFHPHKFRSRAVVSFGQPISISIDSVDMYKLGGDEKREAVMNVVDICDIALKAVTVNAPDYDTLMIIQTARRLYQPSISRSSIEQAVTLNRVFLTLWTKLKDDQRLITINKKAKYYNDMLNFFGIRDHQVERLNITPARATIQLFKRLSQLFALIILGLPALAANLPLIWITDYISQRKQKKALAGSSVKIYGRDVLATWKVIVAAFAAPTLYGVYSLIYFIYRIKRHPHIQLKSHSKRSCYLWAIQVIVYYIAMKMGDTGSDIYKSIKPLFLSIRNPEASKIILSIRNELSQNITQLINSSSDTEKKLDMLTIDTQNKEKSRIDDSYIVLSPH